MLSKKIIFGLLGYLFLAFVSCASNRVYVKTQDTLYEDDRLTTEVSSTSLDGKLQKDSIKNYYNLYEFENSVVATESKTTTHYFIAEKEQTSKSEYQMTNVYLVEEVFNRSDRTDTSDIIGKKTIRFNKNGKLAPYIDSNGAPKLAKGDSFSKDDEAMFSKIPVYLEGVFSATTGQEISEAAGKSYRTESVVKNIEVTSTPNQSFIMYQIMGKPFVILGTASWNILKCVGYALINFTGGYNAVAGKSNAAYWKLPSYKKAKEKAVKAKEANKIAYYPEYHLPFTDNHIVVTTVTGEKESLFVSSDEIKVKSTTRKEIDNTLSVSRSAKADAAQTAAVAGVIGTVITIPVSVVSWIGGAAFGIYGKTQN